VSTIRDVAKKAGVSVSTVSLVLNGHGRKVRIAAATQAHVLSVAKHLGYVPDRRAQSLRSRKGSNTVGVVFVSDRVPEAFFVDIMQAVQSAASLEGWETHFQIMSSKSPETLAALRAMAKELAGAILVGDRDENLYDSTHPLDFPIVRIGAGHPDTNRAVVRVDNRHGGRTVGEHLLELGHRRVAIIGPRQWYTPFEDRRDGIVETLTNAGLEAPVIESEDEPGVEVAHRLYDAGVTATVCLYDRLALRFLQRLNEAGIAVPHQMSLVSFDDLEWAAFLSPSLTTVRIPRNEMGEAAVRLLKQLISGEERLLPHVIKPTLMVRDSTAGAVQV